MYYSNGFDSVTVIPLTMQTFHYDNVHLWYTAYTTTLVLKLRAPPGVLRVVPGVFLRND